MFVIFCRDKYWRLELEIFPSRLPCGHPYKHTFVATKQTRVVATKYVYRDKILFVSIAAKIFFCRDKTRVLSRQTRVSRNKTFVATKMILVAAPAHDNFGWGRRNGGGGGERNEGGGGYGGML